MSFDDEMKNRFANQTPIVTNIDAGAAAAASSVKRRTAAARGIAAIAVFVFVGLGALAIGSNGDTNSLDVAGDPDGGSGEVAEDGENEDSTDPVEEEPSEDAVEVDPEDSSDELDDVGADEEPTAEEPAEDQSASEQSEQDDPEEPPVSTLTGDVFAIANVESDDTLNARDGAGTSFDVVYEFGFDETGIVRTNTETVFIGTSEWVEVYLPVAGRQGWVNSSFLEPITVTDSAPCAFNGSAASVGTGFANTEGSSTSNATVVGAMETYRFGSCIRTVIEFSDGFSSSNAPANPASVLPNDITVTSDGGEIASSLSIIDFGSSVFAAEAAESRFVDSFGTQSIFIFRPVEGNITGHIYGRSPVLDVRFDNTNGTMIIDVADTQAATAGIDPLFDAGSVVVTGISPVPNTDGSTSLRIVGLARPFEANLSVDVLRNGDPLAVDWTGAFRTGTVSTNAVMTTDWSSAWGLFDFTLELAPGIDPFDLVLQIDPSGGAADNPTFVDLVIGELS